jgi:hypothetical protein
MFARFAFTAVLVAGSSALRPGMISEPVLSVGSVPGGGSGFCLFVVGPAATNFVLQTSTDLRSWTTVFQAYGYPTTNPVYRVMDEWQTDRQMFWRATKGEDLAGQEARWRDHEPREYTFRLRHMVSFWEGGVRGTVRVLAGTVVEVTDAVDDRTLQPIPQPKLSDFLTIAELFGEIQREIEVGSEQVQVRYDPGGLYPERILIDRVRAFADDESLYEVSELVSMQP